MLDTGLIIDIGDTKIKKSAPTSLKDLTALEGETVLQTDTPIVSCRRKVKGSVRGWKRLNYDDIFREVFTEDFLFGSPIILH